MNVYKNTEEYKEAFKDTYKNYLKGHSGRIYSTQNAIIESIEETAEDDVDSLLKLQVATTQHIQNEIACLWAAFLTFVKVTPVELEWIGEAANEMQKQAFEDYAKNGNFDNLKNQVEEMGIKFADPSPVESSETAAKQLKDADLLNSIENIFMKGAQAAGDPFALINELIERFKKLTTPNEPNPAPPLD